MKLKREEARPRAGTNGMGGGALGLLLLAALAMGSLPAGAAGRKKDIAELSLEDLLNQEISVASVKPVTTRTAPGIVTLITREDIAASGARDLVDVLRLVPGFFFGHDVTGVVGVGFRGIWGHEGKILLLWDGQEVNELGYSTLQLGGHFPVDQIERIEIIRGPGSVIYGGTAELAVINVVTNIGAGFEGAEGAVRAGRTDEATATRTGSLSFGSHVEESEWYVGGSLAVGQNIRSDRPFTDFQGDTFSMENNSNLDLVNLNLIVRSEKFRLRFLFDDHVNQHRMSYGENLPGAISAGFRSYFADASYDASLGRDVTITPFFSLVVQEPWHNDSVDLDADEFFDSVFARYRFGLRGSWNATEELSFLAGVQYDLTTTDDGPTGLDSWGPLNDVTYHNVAAYAEGSLRHEIANVTLGGRVEQHSEYGGQAVPRVAVTKVMDRFHAKALFSMAFRNPSVQNLRTNLQIQPETTQVFELEAGYQVLDSLFLVANFFDITIDDPIVYDVPDVGPDSYFNFPKTGSRGVELEARFKHERGWLTASYSYYNVAGKNQVSLYNVEGHGEAFLGAPLHKIAAAGSLSLIDGLSLDPSLVYISPRFGFVNDGGSGTPRLARFDPATLLALQLRYQDMLIEGLTASLAVQNLLDENVPFIEPYDGGLAPLPGQSREYLLRLAYSWEKP